MLAKALHVSDNVNKVRSEVCWTVSHISRHVTCVRYLSLPICCVSPLARSYLVDIGTLGFLHTALQHPKAETVSLTLETLHQILLLDAQFSLAHLEVPAEAADVDSLLADGLSRMKVADGVTVLVSEPFADLFAEVGGIECLEGLVHRREDPRIRNKARAILQSFYRNRSGQQDF